MEKAYRIEGQVPDRRPLYQSETDANTPITEMVVNSLITNLHSSIAGGEGRPCGHK